MTVDTGTGEGTIRLDVPGTATITDGAGNGVSNIPFTSGQTYTVDTTAPQVVSITRIHGTPTNAASVGFTVTFDECVTGVSTGDFTLTSSGLTGPAITGLSGSGTTYTVTVGTGTGDGTVRLDVPGTATIADGAGNGVSNLPYTSGETYTVDKTVPVSRLDRNVTCFDSLEMSHTAVMQVIQGRWTGSGQRRSLCPRAVHRPSFPPPVRVLE